MKRASAGRPKEGARAAGPGLAQTGHELRTRSEGGPASGEPAASGPALAGASAAEPYAADAYVVSLPTFEGPLDLLLSIIQKHELDILDIPIGFITSKYLEYLNLMQTLTIDVASEYLVMAATLALIKSKMLLPDAPSDAEDGGEEEEEDPRAELVRRLLEYQKYKAAAEDLGSRDTLGSAVFPRGQGEPRPEGPAPFAAFNIVDLLDAFSKVLERTGTKVEHEVIFDRISITDRIVELTDLLKSRGSVPFEEIFVRENRAPAKFDVVITFLAVLEMCRLRMMRVYQTEALAPIHVDLVLVDDGEPLDMHSAPAARAEEPTGEAPSATEPSVDEPAADEPAADEPRVDAPAADDGEPAAELDDAPVAEDGEPAAAPDDAPAAEAEAAAAPDDAPAAEPEAGAEPEPEAGAPGEETPDQGEPIA